MEAKLVDGRSPPDEGDLVRIRVLRVGDTVVVDRPHRDSPLRINTAAGEVEIPKLDGTYEITGELTRRMFATHSNEPDYFFLEDVSVDLESEDLVELPHQSGPSWQDVDSTDADVDVDVESIMSDPVTTDEAQTRPSLHVAESLSESHNDLLLGKVPSDKRPSSG